MTQAQNLQTGDIIVFDSYHHYDPPEIVARVVYAGQNQHGNIDILAVDEGNRYRTHQLTVIPEYEFDTGVGV